ncbi:MAG: transglutaminase domain-containing protein [Lachnospiraceae bacterium]|nr:transglutaminase domain-containing protein [Lachnospiraceae bacterium]
MKLLYQRFLSFCILTFCLSTMIQGTVQAADKYEFQQDGESMTGFYKGMQMKNVYVALKERQDTYKVVTPSTKGSEVYYFNQNGVGDVFLGCGFVKISYYGQKQTYYLQDGEVITNKIVGNKKQGYYYVDTSGVRVIDQNIKLAVKFVRSHTKSSDSKSQKLEKCYYYLSKKYKYKRYYTNLYPKAKDMKSMAHDMFSKKKGNCHRYAACFAYIARVLGYDTKVVVGDISSSRGGMTPHGWTELKNGGTWYVCDPDMEMNGFASYMKTTTPCRTTVTRKCTMVVKNGKVIWK